jgi:predicted aspartyl protease
VPSTQTPGQDADANADSGRWRASLIVPFAIIGLTVVIIGAIIIAARGEQGRGEAVLAGGSVDDGTLPVTVPYRDIAGAIVIDVALSDESATVPMILDTGAPTIVSEAIAEVLVADSVGTVTTTSIDGQVSTNPVVSLPAIRIGSARFEDIGAVVGAIEPGNPSYCLSQSGFLGTSLMRHAVWRLDPRSHELTIAASVEQLPGLGSAVRIDLARASTTSPSPIVEVAVGGGAQMFLLDTGSDGWIASNPDDVESSGVTIDPDPPTRSVLAYGSGTPFEARVRWTSAAMVFGSAEMELPIATSEVLPPGQGNIGTDFLEHFVVTIDWPNDAIYLEPVDTDPRPSIPASATLGWDDGFVLGSLVEAQSAPRTAGDGVVISAPRLGDPVAAIDGRDATDASFAEFCSRMRDRREPRQMTIAADMPLTVEVGPVNDFYAALDT